MAKETPYKETIFYQEFDPRNFVDVHDLINKMQERCMKLHQVNFNQYGFEVGRLLNNAELHFIKAPVWIENTLINA